MFYNSNITSLRLLIVIYRKAGNLSIFLGYFALIGKRKVSSLTLGEIRLLAIQLYRQDAMNLFKVRYKYYALPCCNNAFSMKWVVSFLKIKSPKKQSTVTYSL